MRKLIRTELGTRWSQVAAEGDRVERHDWSTTAPFLDRRWRLGRLGREILVIAWFTILRVDGEG